MSRRWIWHATLGAALLGSLGLPSAAFAQTSPQTAYNVPTEQLAGLADFIDGVMAQQIATREVAGAVVIVVHQGRVLLARGYGFADVDQGVPVDPQRTLFRLASVSKLFTWAALMQQVEAGRVSLDADVNDYIDFPIPPFEGQPIRVRDLMAHTPGMSDTGRITARSVDELVPYGDWLKAHVPQRLWPAGTEISYSNFGAALAGYIVERVSGEPFADYAERHLFAPLGMESASFREPLPAPLAPRVAKGYRLRDGRFVAKPFELYSQIMPGGSGTASAPDVARFMMAMLNGGAIGAARILKPESVALLMRDSHANAPGLPGMAHGFFVIRNAGPRLVGHGGNTVDFHSRLILAPEAGLGIFVSETGGPGSYGARTELTDALIGRIFPQKPAPRAAAPAGEVVPVGAYRTNRRNYNVPVKPDRDLWISAAGADAITVTRQKSTTYWERIGPLLFEQVTGARAGGPYEQLRFYGEDGRWRLSFSSQPHVAYHQVQP